MGLVLIIISLRIISLMSKILPEETLQASMAKRLPNNCNINVSKGIKSANYHLRNIGKIRKFLNTDTTKSAIVALVTSRLDYCII